MFASDVMTSSKDITQEGINESALDRCHPENNPEFSLDLLVYSPHLLSDVIKEAEDLLRSLVIDWSNDEDREFVYGFLAWYTSRNLPPRIGSKRGVEQWFFSVIGHPALTVCKSLLFRNDLTRREAQRQEFPSLTSAPPTDVTPDVLLVAGDEYPLYKVPVAIEVQRADILQPHFPDVDSREHSAQAQVDTIFAPIQVTDPSIPEGHAIGFKSPDKPVVGNDNLTNVLLRVRCPISLCLVGIDRDVASGLA